MSLSAELIEIVLQLLDEFGESAVFSRTPENAYDVSTGQATDGSTTTYTAWVVNAKASKSFVPQYSEKETSLIATSDIKIMMLHETIEPLIGDVVTFAGKLYRVSSVEKTRLSGTTVLYTLGLRV